ncbi:MAG: S-adenosyl-l-methionine hydroxide adenosyltransferase family protein [Candidatus Thorarchaeota archaeon]
MDPIIGLLTDFGEKGQHYVAAMKALILKINPYVKIVDISHSITPFSIIEASYVLKTVYNLFPEQTIFIIVVDPGVGGEREILVIKTISNFFFIGPNNGIFLYLFEKSEIKECNNIQNEEYFNKPVSSTFHGRDIMAPVAAQMTKDRDSDLKKFGPKFDLKNLEKTKTLYEIDIEKKLIKSTIQYIDSFGNAITTIPMIKNKIKDSELTLKNDSKISLVNRKKIYQGIYTSHFSSVKVDSILFLTGSTGFLEISINRGNASERIGLRVEDNILLKLPEA